MTKLESLLEYIVKHNQFYKSIVNTYGITKPMDISQYPILTRQQLQMNRYNMFSDGYKTKYFNQHLHRQSSSGSSGIPVNVYWDYKNWYASNMSLWRKRLQWYNIYPNDKEVMFTITARNSNEIDEPNFYINSSGNILSINVALLQNAKVYAEIIKIIDEFQPKWFYIKPFVLNKLIQVYKYEGKKPPQTLTYIESVGELLPSDLRRKATDFFNVPIANMYGSEEMNAIAYECPHHCMHILEDNVYIEINNGNEIKEYGEGEAIITNLNNKAMPLIRYNQGDRIKLTKKNGICQCGESLSKIDLIFGRNTNSVQLSNGNELNSYVLIELVAELNNRFNDIILEYRFIYDRYKNQLSCQIYLEDNKHLWKNSLKDVMVNMLNCKFPLDVLDVKIKFVNSRMNLITKNKVLEIVE